MSLSWDPLSHRDFKDLGRFEELKKAVFISLREKVALSAKWLADTVQECNKQGCTSRTCPLYRGMVTTRATEKMLQGKPSPEASSIQWSTVSDMCQTENHRVLEVVCSYDRQKEVAVAVLIPADLLHDIVLPQSLPKWGIWGTAKVSYDGLMCGFARRAFTNSSSVWANAALTRVKFEATVMDKALEDVQFKVPGMEHHRTMEMHLKRSADVIYEEEARSNRRLLQTTINKFWSLVVNSLRQRLSNRAKKIMCRESLNCDGILCDYCRGAMVFQLASLEGQDNKAWSYTFRGQTFDSSIPKQYPRGEWRTALELCSLYQCHDADLLGCVLLHDRSKGFPVALHVPAHFLELSMVRVPPGGVLFWKFLPHEGSLLKALEELLEKRTQFSQGHGAGVCGQGSQGHVATIVGGLPEPGVQGERLPARNSSSHGRQALGR